MAEIRNEKDLEKWLEGKPKRWGTAIAARVALRVAPLAYFKGGNTLSFFLIFRATLVAEVASRWKAKALITAAFRAADAVADVADLAEKSAYDAARSVYYAAAAVHPAYGTQSAIEALYAAISATLFSNSLDLQNNIQEDTNNIKRRTVKYIIARPLWLNRTPDTILERWTEIVRDLCANAAHWQVWIDWYEDRLAGKPLIREIHEKWALLPEEAWAKGPDHVNPILKQIEDEYRAKQAESDPAPPGQVPAGLQFGGDPDAPVLIIDHPGNGLNTSQDQRDAHWAVVDKARLLDGLCDSSNSLSRLRGFVRRLLDVAGASLEDVRVRAFWSAMNSLRAREQADQAARAASDPDTPPFSEEVAAALSDLVSELNLFAAHEPKLARLDILTSDPSLRHATPEALEARDSLVTAARGAPQVIDPTATKTLERVNEDAKGGTVAHGRADAFAQFSTLNLTIELLRRAKAFGKRVKDGATKVAGIAIETISFIQRHEPLIRSAILALPPGGLQATLLAILDSIMMIKL